MDVVVREARESELAEIGAVTAEIYEGMVSPEYLEVLRDARSRWEAPATAQLVAFDDGTDDSTDDGTGSLLGVAVLATSGSPWQDIAADDDEAEIRMLGVRAPARGRGVGEALVNACVALAKTAGAARIVLSTEPEMTDAQRLYARLGFARVPERDWEPRPGLSLLAYALELPEYCGHCGELLTAGAHEACAARLELEPPRYCGQCARRMVVQVLPSGWTARCSRHGSVSGPVSQGTARPTPRSG